MYEALDEIFEFISKKEANEIRRQAIDVYSADDPRLAVTRSPLHERIPGDENRYMTRNDRLAYHKKHARKARRGRAGRRLAGGALGLATLVGASALINAKNKKDK